MSFLDSESEKAYYFSAKTEFLLRENRLWKPSALTMIKFTPLRKGSYTIYFIMENIVINKIFETLDC